MNRYALKPSIKNFFYALLFYLFMSGPALALDPQKSFTQFSHDIWRTENGLPQNTVRAVTQTEDGYLWLATEEGLVRFDGNQFAVFDKQNTKEFKSNYVRGLLEDKSGNLWISTIDGLVRLANGKFTALTTKDGLPSNNIESLYEDRKGYIWIATANGLSRFKDGALTTYTTQDGLTNNNIEAVFEDSAGTLWVGTVNGLNRFQEGKFNTYTAENRLSNNAIRTIYEDNEGGLWIGTHDGLNFLKDGKLSIYSAKDGLASNSVMSIHQARDRSIWFNTLDGLSRLKNGLFTTYTTKDGLASNRVETIYEDREGSLWIGTAGGLSRFANEAFTNFTTKEGLSSNTVLTIYEDREDSIWIGTEAGGLNQLKEKKFTAYTTKEGLSSDVIKAIYEDRAGNLWVGTHEGGLNFFKDGKVSVYTTKDGLASNIVLSIFEDREGRLWIGTPDGLNRFHNGKFTTYTIANGLTDDFIRSIYADKEGNLWIGTRRGLTRIKDEDFTYYTTLDGLANDFVGALHEDSEGNLWIGTMGGLNKFKDGKFISYTTENGLSSNVVISLYEDQDKTLWIGTSGGGLNRLKDGKFTSYTTKEGLFDDVIYRVLEDGNANLWIGCNKGIFHVIKKELDDFANKKINYINPVPYGTADGMKTRECSGGGHPAAWKTKDGRLWFATIKGIAMIDPAKIKINEQAPPVVIEHINVDDESIDPNQNIELGPGKTRFDFYYTGLSFIAPEKVRFKYKLEGFDQDWIDGGTRRVAYYTNLPPGNYRFRVIACNNDGVWNQTGAFFELYLRPHFYQTYWFYALLLASLILFVGLLYRLRVKRIEAQFAAVLAERNRIAREIHDNLAQEISGVSVQLEIVARMMTVSTEAARTHLDQARILVRQSIAEARRYVWDLRSQALENSDLPTALSETARRLTASTDIQAQVEVNGTFRPLTEQIESNLLRIGQEAINNAIKHGHPKQIRITLSFDAKHVRLMVRDDGTGFDTGASANGTGEHFGLIGMRERAKQIGGKLTIHSEANVGTEIIVEAPINS